MPEFHAPSHKPIVQPIQEAVTLSKHSLVGMPDSKRKLQLFCVGAGVEAHFNLVSVRLTPFSGPKVALLCYMHGG